MQAGPHERDRPENGAQRAPPRRGRLLWRFVGGKALASSAGTFRVLGVAAGGRWRGPERRADGATAPPASGAPGLPPPAGLDPQDNNHADLVPIWHSRPVDGAVPMLSPGCNPGSFSDPQPVPSCPPLPKIGRPRVYPKGEDRRVRWAAEQAAAGIVRVYVRAHADDCEEVRAYAASLLSSRAI